MYQVIFNGGLNLATKSIDRAKSRAYDLLITGHKNVELVYPE